MITTTPLRRFRLKYRITLDEIAAVVGVSNQYLSALERGKISASYEQQAKIANVFIRLAEERSNSLYALDKELLAMKDRLFTPMEAEDEL